MNCGLFFNQDHNCWRHDRATYAAPIVDGADYFRALHQAITNAKHSIFIVGWDIDSRIQLLRGDEAEQSGLPAVISDLIAQKAEQNPDLQVYLLRWDSSLAFFGMREVWAKEVWDNKVPGNVHTLLDDTIPMGGSQHQKVVVIDDEIAFSGGMDVAVHRWDTREHKVVEPRRTEDDGPYVPLHDVHSVVAGPIVRHFAELVRWRWERIATEPAIAPRVPSAGTSLPPAWPQSVTPYFQDIPCAIARTIPVMDNAEPAQEVRRMLLDAIARAEEFIYIENQFASRQEIAEAIHTRLLECPKLKVLLVSSYSPKSTMECEAYWAGRIDFKKILERGINKHRVLFAYSGAFDEDDNFAHKRVHSKVMVVDDEILVIGSANISNRSMTLDTECDLIFAAETPKHKEQVAQFRNDLISEHSGWSIPSVARILKRRHPFVKLCNPKNPYGYRLSEVEDEMFTDQSLHSMVQPFSDPEEPLVRPFSWNGKRLHIGNPSKKVIVTSGLLMLFALLVGGGYFGSTHIEWLDKEHIEAFLSTTQGTIWALPAVCAVYVLAGLLFFPVTVLSIAVAVIFGPVWGPIYGICGAVSSAALLFIIGRAIGGNGLKKFGGNKVQALDERFRRSGILGVATLRLVPIAPFSLVNLVAGVTSVHLSVFLAGTFLGMLPQMIVKGVVGDSLTQIFMNPTPTSIGYLIGGIVLWILVIYLSQKAVNYFQNKKTNSSENTDKSRRDAATTPANANAETVAGNDKAA